MRQRCCHHRPASEERIALYDLIVEEKNILGFEDLMQKVGRQDLREQMSIDEDLMLARLFPKAPKHRPNPHALLHALVIMLFPKEVFHIFGPIQNTLYLAACDVMAVLIQFVNEGTALHAEPPGDMDYADESDPHDMSNDDVIKALDNYADALEAWLVISKDNTLTPFAAEAIAKYFVDHPDVDYWSPASLAETT